MGWNNKYLDVDIQKKNLLRIEVNQADDVFFYINLYDNGKPLDLVNGEDTVIINFVNANNTITADSNIGKNFNKNLLEIYLNKNCTNSYGVAKMQVTINTTKKDVTNRQVTTFPIEIKVNKSIMDGQEVSENVNSMIDDINKATVKGNQVIKNIEETASKYPTSSQLYSDVEDLKIREYGAENLLKDAGFYGSIGEGFCWKNANSDTNLTITYEPALKAGNYMTLSSNTAQPGVMQTVDTGGKLKSSYTVSLRVHGTAGNVVYIALHGVETKSYTFKNTNVWENVVVTFNTNVSNWSDKQLIIFGTAKSTFLITEVAMWEGKNSFSFKFNSKDPIYDRIKISGKDVLGINKSGKYAGINCINNPFNDSVTWAYYDVEVHSSTYKKVIARSYHSSLEYVNTMNNGTWSGWVNKSNLSSYTQDSTHRLVSDAEKNKWNNASNYKSETFEPVTKKGIGIDSTGFNNLEGIFAVENKTNLSTLHIVVNGNSIGTVNVGGTGFIRYTAVRTSASWVISTVGKFSASGSEDINKIDIITPSNGEIMALGLDTQSSDTLKGRCTVKMW